MSTRHNRKFKVGDKVLLDAVVTEVKGETVVVQTNIVTTHRDLHIFDEDPAELNPGDPGYQAPQQSTTSILD